MRSALLLFASLLAASCSLTEFHRDRCHSAADCRAAFGFASVCDTANGLCSAAGTTNLRCPRAYPPDLFTTPETYRDWLVVGAMLNENDPGDVAAENAITLAVQQVNDYGGLGVNVGAVGDGGARAGIRFAVAFCTAQDDHVAHAIDGLDSDAAAAAVARYLANDLGVPVILGPSTSIQAEAAYHALFPTLTSAPPPAGPVFISHSATSPALTGDDIWGLFWRTVPSDAVQGRVIAQDITMRHGATARIAEIVETGPYGDGLQEAFRGAFAPGVPTVLSFTAGTDAMRGAQVMSVGAQHANYDEVLFISSAVADEPAFLTYAASLGTYASLDIFLTDTAASSSAFLSASGSASTLFPRVRGTRFALASGTVYDQFVAAYSAAFMPPPAMDIHNYQYAPGAYDAAWLAFAGASWAFHNAPDGAITGRAVSEGLRHVSGHGTPLGLLPGNWAAIDAAFNMRPPMDVNVNGVSGALDYDPVTEETTGPVEVWRIDTTVPAMPRIVVDHTVVP